MKLNDTVIQTAGVFRCCIHSIVQQGDKKIDVEIGDKMTCQYCKRDFELKAKPVKPVWEPITL